MVQLGNIATTGTTSTSLDFKVLNKFGDIAGGILVGAIASFGIGVNAMAGSYQE